jgi:beta-galactosidase GanA
MADRHDYTEDVADAVELIEEFGQSGFLRRIVSTGPANNPTQTKTDYPATFAVLAYTSRQIDGTRILATDRMVYLSALGLAVAPAITDKLVDAAGVVYNVISITPFSPAGTVVYFEVQVRR